MRAVYVVLLHDPIVNRNGSEVITMVTNLDIHDIARSSKTYGVRRYFIVNPEVEQERIVHSILKHWNEEVSKVYHPARASALETVRFVRTFEEAFNESSRESGEPPFVVMPDAKPFENAWSYSKLRKAFTEGKFTESDQGTKPLMIVFGTGWGIAPKFYEKVDAFLKPLERDLVFEGEKYNHLSVRAAAAIILDRLFGKRD